MASLTYNGTDLSTYGLTVTGLSQFPLLASPRLEVLDLGGRSGSVISGSRRGRKDITAQCAVAAVSRTQLLTYLDAIGAILDATPAEVEFSFSGFDDVDNAVDRVHRGRCTSGIHASPIGPCGASFDLSFIATRTLGADSLTVTDTLSMDPQTVNVPHDTGVVTLGTGKASVILTFTNADATAVNCVQKVQFVNTPTAGTYALNIGGIITGAIQWDATASEVQTAIYNSATPHITTTVTAITGGFRIEFNSGSYANSDVPLITVLSGLMNRATAPYWVSAVREMQGGGTFQEALGRIGIAFDSNAAILGTEFGKVETITIGTITTKSAWVAKVLPSNMAGQEYNPDPLLLLASQNISIGNGYGQSTRWTVPITYIESRITLTPTEDGAAWLAHRGSFYWDGLHGDGKLAVQAGINQVKVYADGGFLGNVDSAWLYKGVLPTGETALGTNEYMLRSLPYLRTSPNTNMFSQDNTGMVLWQQSAKCFVLETPSDTTRKADHDNADNFNLRISWRTKGECLVATDEAQNGGIQRVNVDGYESPLDDDEYVNVTFARTSITASALKTAINNALVAKGVAATWTQCTDCYIDTNATDKPGTIYLAFSADSIGAQKSVVNMLIESPYLTIMPIHPSRCPTSFDVAVGTCPAQWATGEGSGDVVYEIKADCIANAVELGVGFPKKLVTNDYAAVWRPTLPDSGGFQIRINKLGTYYTYLTGVIPFSASAQDVRAALNALDITGSTYASKIWFAVAANSYTNDPTGQAASSKAATGLPYRSWTITSFDATFDAGASHAIDAPITATPVSIVQGAAEQVLEVTVAACNVGVYKDAPRVTVERLVRGGVTNVIMNIEDHEGNVIEWAGVLPVTHKLRIDGENEHIETSANAGVTWVNAMTGLSTTLADTVFPRITGGVNNELHIRCSRLLSNLSTAACAGSLVTTYTPEFK